MDNKLIVVKLGGSLVSPSQDKVFDFDYLKKLKELLIPYFSKDYKFFFILGGGYTMRMYRDKAMEAGVVSNHDLHWIGTTVNVLHGEIFRAFFSEYAEEGTFKFEDYYNNNPVIINKNIKAAGGGRPGHSGDVDASLIAIRLKTNIIINLKNIDQIYTADPKKDSNAKPLDELSWKDYLNIIGNPKEHTPGGNFPVDPIASKICMDNNLTMIVMSGWDLSNFDKYLKGEKFKGTIVHN